MPKLFFIICSILFLSLAALKIFIISYLYLNWDFAIFLDYFYRLSLGQTPHLDFITPFGFSVGFLYEITNYFDPFLEIFFIKSEILIHKFNLSLTLISLVVGFLSLFILQKWKINNLFKIIISLFIFSYAITSRAHGYDTLIAFTSFYNHLVISIFFITVIYGINIYNLSRDSVTINYFTQSVQSFTVGLLICFAIFLKITGLVCITSVVILLFLLLSNRIDKNIIKFNLLFLFIGV